MRFEAARGRVKLFPDCVLTMGEPVPEDIWDRLPPDKRRILIDQRWVKERRGRGRPKGSKDSKPRKRAGARRKAAAKTPSGR